MPWKRMRPAACRWITHPSGPLGMSAECWHMDLPQRLQSLIDEGRADEAAFCYSGKRWGFRTR
jgi:hypothetical protein